MMKVLKKFALPILLIGGVIFFIWKKKKKDQTEKA